MEEAIQPVEASCVEGTSRNESEPRYRASLATKKGSGEPAYNGETRIHGEEMRKCNRGAPRSGRGWRVLKELQRNLGDPKCGKPCVGKT